MAGFPAMIQDEREQLLGFLQQQRDLARLAAYGLTDEQAGAAPAASALCVGGIIRHLAATERSWAGTIRQQPAGGSIEDYAEQFRMTPGRTLAAVLDDYAVAAADTDALVRSLPLDHPVPVPKGVPWFPQDLDAWDVRWIVLHLIEETARHAGHADIVRETVDGATWFALMAAAEGWSVLPPGVQPWTPRRQGPRSGEPVSGTH